MAFEQRDEMSVGTCDSLGVFLGGKKNPKNEAGFCVGWFVAAKSDLGRNFLLFASLVCT